MDRPGEIGEAVSEALKADVPSIVEIAVDPEELEQPARASDAVKTNRR